MYIFWLYIFIITHCRIFGKSIARKIETPMILECKNSYKNLCISNQILFIIINVQRAWSLYLSIKALPRFIYYLLRTFSMVKANVIIYKIWYLKHNMIKLIIENFSVSQYLIISITIKLLRVNFLLLYK